MIRKLLKQKLKVSYDSKSIVYADRHHLSENDFVLSFLFFAEGLRISTGAFVTGALWSLHLA